MNRLALHTLLATGLWLGQAATAAELTAIDPSKSRIGFTYSQMGVASEGRFTSFGGQIAFDPAKPQNARARIEVKLASVDTGLEEANAEVAGKDWFDSKSYPVARFEASSIKPLGGNRYQLAGRLTIKGRTKAVSAPFTYSPDATGGTFAGQLTLQRADFAIGEGAWRDFSVVGNDIGIRFQLRAVR